jgi:beta-glucosidase
MSSRWTTFYGEKLKQAVEAGKVPMAELDDHVHRILRSEFEAGLSTSRFAEERHRCGGQPCRRAPHCRAEHRSAQEQGVALLPLDRSTVRSIAVIGPHADTGMISGGGSAQVDPKGPAGRPLAVACVVPDFALEGV